MVMLNDPNFPKGGLAIKPSLPNGDIIKDSDEDIVQYGIAGRIWEASYLLQQYLQPNSSKRFDPSPVDVVKGGVVIELGSGVGLVGIHLAKHFDSHVILTDLHNVLPLLQRNVERSGVDQSKVEVKPLPWGSFADAQSIIDEIQNKQFINIVCSDLVYFPELLPPLLRTLIQLTSFANSAKILISYKIRSLAKEQPFWHAFGAWFDFQPVTCQDDEKMPLWRLFGSRKADMYTVKGEKEKEETEDEVYLFVGQRKQETLDSTADIDDTQFMQGFMRTGGCLHQAKGTETFEIILLSNLRE